MITAWPETTNHVHFGWKPGMIGLAPMSVRLARNGKNPGIFSEDFSKSTESDLKNPRICSIWDQFDPLLAQI